MKHCHHCAWNQFYQTIKEKETPSANEDKVSGSTRSLPRYPVITVSDWRTASPSHQHERTKINFLRPAEGRHSYRTSASHRWSVPLELAPPPIFLIQALLKLSCPAKYGNQRESGRDTVTQASGMGRGLSAK